MLASCLGLSVKELVSLLENRCLIRVVWHRWPPIKGKAPVLALEKSWHQLVWLLPPYPCDNVHKSSSLGARGLILPSFVPVYIRSNATEVNYVTQVQNGGQIQASHFIFPNLSCCFGNHLHQTVPFSKVSVFSESMDIQMIAFWAWWNQGKEIFLGGETWDTFAD